MSTEMIMKLAEMKKQMLPESMVKHIDVIEDEMIAMLIDMAKAGKERCNMGMFASGSFSSAFTKGTEKSESKEESKVKKVNID